MPLFLLSITIIAASVHNILLHKIPRNSDIITFNLICSVIWFFLLFFANGFKLNFSESAVIWGIVYGTVQMFFMLFKTMAMNSGPVSITTLIGNCSLLLSTSVGVIVWNEKISIYQILGIAFLIVAFFLCTYSKDKSSGSVKWVIYCVFFFIFASGAGISFKFFSKTPGNENSANDMMIISSVTMFVLLLIVKVFNITKTGTDLKSLKFSKSYLLTTVFSGLLSVLYNRLNIILVGKLPAAIFYPCFNGGVILLSLLLSITILKERITKMQAMGLTLGTIAVLIIGFC